MYSYMQLWVVEFHVSFPVSQLLLFFVTHQLQVFVCEWCGVCVCVCVCVCCVCVCVCVYVVSLGA